MLQKYIDNVVHIFELNVKWTKQKKGYPYFIQIDLNFKQRMKNNNRDGQFFLLTILVNLWRCLKWSVS